MAQGRSTKSNSMMKWIRTSRFSIKNSLSSHPYYSFETMYNWILCRVHLSSKPPMVLTDPLSRANMAHIRQSKPDYGLGFQVKSFNPSKLGPAWTPFRAGRLNPRP